MKKTKTPIFRTIISMMISPATALKSAVAGIPWFFSLGVSALAFAFFFMQTGLDLYKTGQKGLQFVMLSAGAGIVYGITVIPLLGAIIWVILKLTKSDKSIGWAISSFCLSYSGALIYGICGILFSFVFGWKTSIAFGVTGVLWATGPIIMSIREMTGGKSTLSIPLATIAGAVVLFTWSFFGKI
ncbi:MAG: hypothetical protein VR72_09250 [Clostridiaceae bacterium BRH_c20a]|nr:MAG: hypothetical protein VR72_09250 [Clostridiaceae bacterium BRH_c20a]